MDNKLYYNAEQKQKFLDYIRKERYSDVYCEDYATLFNKTAYTEMKKSKDISFFTKDELLSMYQTFECKSTSLWILHTRLNKYVLFFNPDNEESRKISTSDVKAVSSNRDATILSYKDIELLLDSLENAVDKFLLYGLYCGIKGKGYVELGYSSMNDSDANALTIWLADIKEDGEIDYKHRKFKTDYQLFHYASVAANTNEYKVIEWSGRTRLHQLAPERGRIVKNQLYTDETRNKELKSRKIKNKLMNLFTVLGLAGEYTPLDIYWSGFFYHANLLAIQNHQQVKTKKDFFNIENIDKLIEQYSTKKTQINRAMDRYF